MSASGARLSASVLVFPDRYVGARAAGSVLVRAARPVSCRVEIDGDFATTRAGTRRISGGGLQIPVTFTPTASGARSGALRIAIAGEAPLICALSGVGLARLEPTVRDGVAELAFGTLEVDGTLTLPVIVEHPAGTQDPEACAITARVRGAAASQGGGSYTVSPSGAQSIPGGGALTLNVTFSPGAPRSFAAILDIDWVYGRARGELTVALQGVGHRPAPQLPPPRPLPTTPSNPSPPPVGGAPSGTPATTAPAEPAVPDATHVSDGARRRASWFVPTHESYVSLGQAWTPQGMTTTQPGFTASTTRHVFLRAGGSVTFQAENGPTWFQSEEGPLYMVSGQGSYMVAAGTLYVGGGGYVGVMAGYAGEPIPEGEVALYDDPDPARPAPVDKIPPSFLAADLVWQIVDKIVGVVSAAKLAEHLVYLGKHKSSLGRFAIAVSTSAQVVGMTTYIMGKAMGAPEKTLNFYSQAGILAGTPAFCSIHGGLGVNYRSANITLLGNVAVAVNSIVSTSLDSLFGDTAVVSNKVNATSWMGASFFATLGKATMLGPTIKLGGLAPDGMQLPTLKMAFEALDTVDLLACGVGAKLELKARTFVPWPDPVPTLEVRSALATFEAPTTTIRLNSGPGVVAWTIEAGPAGVTIKNLAGEVLSLKPGLIALGPASGQIKMTPASTDVGGGAMMLTPANIMVSGFGDLL